MFVCEYCEQTFVEKHHISRHINCCKKRPKDLQLTESKSPNCDKAFSLDDSDIRHLRTSRSVQSGAKRVCDSDSKLSNKKQRCDVCNNNVKSLHNHLKSQTQIVASAFKSRIISYRLSACDKHLIPKVFMDNVRQRFINLVNKTMFRVKSDVKVNLELFGMYCKWTKDCEGDGEEVREIKSFNTKNKVINAAVDDLNEIYNSFIEEICTKADEFQERDSGWAISEVLRLEININKFSPLKGSNYIPLPKWIQDKKACVNVHNADDACFAWAIVSALYPAKKNALRTSSYPDYKDVLKLEGLSFPMTLKGIRDFEELNDISVNVFDIAKKIISGPVYHTKRRRKKHVNLLIIENGEKRHYCWIKNLSRLIRSQISKHEGQMWICDGCLLSFSNKLKFKDHIKHDCSHVRTIMPSPENNILKFRQFRNQLRAPVVVYADFEAFLTPIAACSPSQSSSYTTNYQVHEPYSFAYFIKCTYSQSKFITYRGKDCAKEFLASLEKELKPYVERMKKIIPMRPLTPQQHADFESAINCHVCGKILLQDRVHDHDHLTGAFRGAAHANCNLNFKHSNVIPIFMHNLSGYDSHFIIKSFQKYDNVNIIPKNKENFVSFTKKSSALGVDLRFVDSFKFMSSSLDKLVNNLSKSKFNNVKSHFPCDKLDLLCRKGIFPYDYVDCWKKLEEKSLPPMKAFYSSLSKSDISDDDYAHAQNVWDAFNVKTLGEYSDIYLKTDVLLLADVFENFRELCANTYQLDPAHYFTGPGLSWDAMLKYTKIEMELLTDLSMIKFISNGTRGGLSQCCGRYAEANNKYMDDYNSEKPSKYIVYLDANNLYGWAMSQYLPVGNFRWLSEEEIVNLDVNKLRPDDDKGYFLEVDLEYPEYLHNLHNDLPFCFESKIPPMSKSKTCKLLATLEEKSNYIIHCINLQQAVRHGLVVKKIHRVLEFAQRPWLKPYIDLNTEKRTLARNAFEKDFYKLMNNSVYGKTMENIDKRVDVRIISCWENQGKLLGARALISRLNFHSLAIIDENIVIIQMKRTLVKYNKPTYIGFSVLELSKTLMFDFHYDYMLPKYGDNIQLLYTDTDSLIYNIATEDFYSDIAPDLTDKFDTSDFDEDNIYNLPRVNKKVLGKMKDECSGTIITKFIGIRSKCYYVEKAGGDVIKKIKGIKTEVVAEEISGEDYYNCVTGAPDQYRKMNIIRSNHHEIYTQTINKIALKNYDDKRFFIPDMPHETLALGHSQIEKYSIKSCPRA